MEQTYDFSDVLIVPQPTRVSSRKNVELKRHFKFKHSPLEIEIIPIMASNMDTIGTLKMCKELSKHCLFTCLHKFISLEEFIEEKKFLNSNLDYFAVSIGYNDSEIIRLKKLHEHVKFKCICIDVANGYILDFVKYCKKIRFHFPDKIIIAGNVVCNVMANMLYNEGEVDIIKCGIGGGSACTTRIKTGVGMPQLSCIKDCADKTDPNCYIISDGGITCPGDVGKAFGAGADFVMIGGQFGGHKENPGEIIEENGKKYKLFYGMSSTHAMNKNYGGKNTYRTSEGRCLKIPYKGELKGTIEDYLGGLRSTCTYVDCSYIEELKYKTEFVLVHNQYNAKFL